ITHDLALVAGMVDKVAVMYSGYIVEHALVNDLYQTPMHPYTLGLLHAMPKMDAADQSRLASIDGLPPDLRYLPQGCPFVPRCPYVIDKCRQENPTLIATGSHRQSACWRWEDIREEKTFGESV
ncbi:MAG: oligopeptide/dipeptide ABC transporter ATP-binding protein, partial [Anaerolineae bacterium]